MRWFLLFSLGLLTSFSLVGQNQQWAPEETYEEVVGDEDFYEKNPEKEQEKESSSKLPSVPSELFSGIALAFLLFFGIFIIYKIWENNKGMTGVKKSSRIKALTLKDAEENLRHRDLSGLLEIAYSNNDYRTIIRLEYLSLLQTLDDENRIEWKRQKTDYMYLNELSSKEVKEPFQELIRMFQYTWYGKLKAEKTHVDQSLSWIVQCKTNSHE